MQITKISLIQFLDNCYAKIFHKLLGVVRIKVNIFIDIFEVKDHPLFMVSVINWWWQTFFRYSSQKPRRGNTIHKIHNPKWGFHHPKRAGPIQRGGLLPSKTSMIKLTFIFKPPQGLLNILAQKLSRNWLRVIFVICINGAVEGCAKLLFCTHR